MPPKAKAKKKATEAGLISSRLRERRSEIYDEDVADEEDAEAELLECASDDEAGAEAQAAPSVAAGRGKGRGICCRRLALSSASRLFAPQARRACCRREVGVQASACARHREPYFLLKFLCGCDFVMLEASL